ncbi:DUF2252 family protein, partial [Nocardia cyriacigeorgica]
ELAHHERQLLRGLGVRGGHAHARPAEQDICFGLNQPGALLYGNDGEVLVLQLKQARPSALTPFVSHTPPRHEGERIV